MLRKWCVTGLALALLAGCGSGDDDGTGPGTDEDAVKEAAAEARAAEAAEEFEGLVESGNPDPVGALVASLEADPTLSDVQRVDSSGTVVATRDGVPFAILTSEEDRPEWTETAEGVSLAGFLMAPPIACDSANYPRSKKACILRSTLTAAGAVNDFGIEQSLQQAGFTPTAVTWPTTVQQVIDLHQTLSTCGVIYIRAHGGAAKNLAGEFGNHLVTEVTSATPQEKQLLKSTFGADAKRFFGVAAGTRTKKSYITLTPQFFASVQYPNSLVFNNACGSHNSLQGLAGGAVLKDAFLGAGAGAVLGWNSTVSASLAGRAANEVFAGLAPKVLINTVTVSVTPPDPGPGESYVPSATISPAAAGVEVSLSVRGTDGFTRDETATTDAGGAVTFASIPGGQGEVIDSITVVAGGAGNSLSTLNAVQNSPSLQDKWSLRWGGGVKSITGLNFEPRNDNANFNLVCNNENLRQTVEVVKF
jgi:hypothetical protein